MEDIEKMGFPMVEGLSNRADNRICITCYLHRIYDLRLVVT